MNIVVLISGGGTNLQAIIDAAARGEIPVKVAAVVSDKADAFGLERARRAGIRVAVLEDRIEWDRPAYDRSLARVLERFQPGLLVLAGFMRILTPQFVNSYAGRMLNIHPSLLPAFRGLNTHRRALEAGVKEHGASVHFVTPELDAGPIIVQARVPVLPGDSAEALAARVLEQEHRIYPLAIRWFAEGRLRLTGNTVVLDGLPLDPAGFQYQPLPEAAPG